MKKQLKIVPLGGFGEIGKNMTVFEYGDSMFVVDAGILFPSSYFPGIDYIIPDIEYIKKRKKKLKGFVITHGHEDHIGALPYIADEFKGIPIYVKRLTKELIKRKFKEKNIPDSDLRLVEDYNDKISLGDFTVRMIHVNHSIPDASALHIRAGKKNVFFSGDFKIDYTPVNEDVIDLKTISRIGEKGVDLLLIDSTNVEKEGMTGSERDVGREMEKLTDGLEGRIFVATFASNISRIIQVLEIAKKTGRKVIVEGRSLKNNIEIASKLGYIDLRGIEIIDIAQMKMYEDSELMILVTGSQGETFSVLQRLALNIHGKIKIKEGDKILISAKKIPGNEIHINRMINNLFKCGADVEYENVSEIHVSGHAARDDIKMIVTMVAPKYVIPYHGEYRNMASLRKLLVSMGYKKESVLLAENGTPVIYDGKEAYLGSEKVEYGKKFIEDADLGNIGEHTMRQRKVIGQEGALLIIYDYHEKSGDIIYGPEISSVGIEISPEITGDVKERLQDILYSMSEEERNDRREVARSVDRRIRRFLKKRRSKTPVVVSPFPEHSDE